MYLFKLDILEYYTIVVTSSMNAFIDRIWARKLAFIGTFFIVFTLSYVLLQAIDFLPEPLTSVDTVELQNTQESLQILETAGQSATGTVLDNQIEKELDTSSEGALDRKSLPVSLSIPKLDRTISVLNPTSRTIADLDTALLEGVVRHPDSATLSQEGTVFILGHSSYLPQVFNKSFQAFNGIQNLEWGDTIEVSTTDAVYEYRVEKVYRAKAQDLTVPIAGTGKMLTLATCNSFGSVDDRYIVEAKQISVLQ